MQAVDLPRNPSLDHRGPDPSMASEHYSPIHSPNHNSSKKPENKKSHVENDTNGGDSKDKRVKKTASENNGGVGRRERPSRACTQRAAARMQAAAEAEAAAAEAERKKKKAKRKQKLAERLLKEDSDEEDGFREEEEGVAEKEEDAKEVGSTSRVQSSRMVTPLLGEPEASQLPRWNIRSMWQLASILNFLNVFRPLLNVKVEFSAEEFETALITPNSTLAEIHMPLLKAIPPVTRMALGHATWITVLCRKIRDWWYWVAEGDLPIFASHGAEVEAYNALDPRMRVIILKALCDIRVEQEDIRNYIDDSIKHGVQLSTLRKERLGGDSYGVSYWYEDDPIIGHRLYRETRKVEVKKGKGRNIPPIPHSSYQWEAVATNLDEFQIVAEKLFSSKNRTEVSVGKKLKNNMLPEIEMVHKKKEKLLKKQHRQALMLDSMISMDGLGAGRSLRDRKPVTYTFDDYDRSINEALKVTKKQQADLESFDGREPRVKAEGSTNGRLNGPSEHSPTFAPLSPKSPDDDEFYDDQTTQTLDRGERRRQRPQRYSVKEYVEAISDNEADFDSDDDIVGEVVYDDEYLRSRKRRKVSSSSEGDEEYNWDEENHEDEDEEEDDDVLSMSEDSDEPRRFKPAPGRTRRETKLKSVGQLQSGLRRSKRATRTRIDYTQYEMSESDNESKKPKRSKTLDEHSYSSGNEDFSMASQDSDEDIEHSERVTRTRNNFRQFQMSESDNEWMKPEKSNALHEPYYSSDNADFSRGSHGSDEKINNQNIHAIEPIEQQQTEVVEEKEKRPHEEKDNGAREEVENVKERHFLDLNELAPGSGFDDGPNSMRDEDRDNI